MSGSVVRLIAGKEFRDLIRDRRTVLLILVLPAVLYPLFLLAALLFVVSLAGQVTVVGVVNPDALTGVPVPLIDGPAFAPGLDTTDEAVSPAAVVKTVTGDPRDALRSKEADVVLVLPATLAADLVARDRRPVVRILDRDGDEKSKLAAKRLGGVVRAWAAKLRERKFVAAKLPADFDKVLTIEDPQADKPKDKKAADELRDTFARIFPFILIMWLVAGAIQPAVDMTAGEKERGTMETLLISPAERSEIVVGKFLATTAFAYATVVWNVLWLTAGALIAERALGFQIISLPGVIGCMALGLPQAALFSAVCLALGVFAKSTKEGQYYLMPLILVTMPLAFWSMLPGTELSPATCWVPVTGPMLLQGRLLSVSGEAVPWAYFAPVLASSALWVALALALAVRQFKSEAVLFREGGPAWGNPFGRLFARRPVA